MSKLGLGTVQFGTDYGLNSVDGQVRPKEVKKIFDQGEIFLKEYEGLSSAALYP